DSERLRQNIDGSLNENTIGREEKSMKEQSPRDPRVDQSVLVLDIAAELLIDAEYERWFVHRAAGNAPSEGQRLHPSTAPHGTAGDQCFNAIHQTPKFGL